MKHILSTFCLFAACGPLMAQNAVESVVKDAVATLVLMTLPKSVFIS